MPPRDMLLSTGKDFKWRYWLKHDLLVELYIGETLHACGCLHIIKAHRAVSKMLLGWILFLIWLFHLYISHSNWAPHLKTSTYCSPYNMCMLEDVNASLEILFFFRRKVCYLFLVQMLYVHTLHLKVCIKLKTFISPVKYCEEIPFEQWVMFVVAKNKSKEQWIAKWFIFFLGSDWEILWLQRLPCCLRERSSALRVSNDAQTYEIQDFDLDLV